MTLTTKHDLRDQLAAHCKTPADRRTLKRYDQIMKECRDAMVTFAGEQRVRHDEEREAEADDHLLRLLD